MNEVLLRRLVGACMLILVAFSLTLILPDPQMPVAPEPGLKVVEVGVNDPRSIPSTAAPQESAQPAEAEPAPAPPPRVAGTQSPAPVHRIPSAPTSSLEMATSPEATIEDDDAAGPPNTDADTPMPDEPTAMAEPRPTQAPAAKPTAAAAEHKPPAKPVAAESTASNKAKPAPVPPPKPPAVAVAVAPKPAAPPAAAATVKPSASSRWAVQAGVYADMANAQKVDAQLKSLGLSSAIRLVDTSGGARYRVRSGPYPSRDAAEAAKKRLAQARIAANVVPDGG